MKHAVDKNIKRLFYITERRSERYCRLLSKLWKRSAQEDRNEAKICRLVSSLQVSRPKMATDFDDSLAPVQPRSASPKYFELSPRWNTTIVT